MCNVCGNPNHSPFEDERQFEIDIENELDKLESNLSELEKMWEAIPEMTKKDRSFAEDLYQNYLTRGSLTFRQWEWVSKLTDRVRGVEPIYGSFDPILVMFRLAGAHGLKKPKVRLLSKEDRYVQLNFKPGEKDEKTVDVYVDGWQGHGHRKFAGWIHKDRIVPYSLDRMTDDVRNVIQDLALDPLGTAKAMAGKLGVCMYCGQRLSDDRSKKAGYGPICADHWGLPWGDEDDQEKIKECTDMFRRFFGVHPHNSPHNFQRKNMDYLDSITDKFSEKITTQALNIVEKERME